LVERKSQITKGLSRSMKEDWIIIDLRNSNSLIYLGPLNFFNSSFRRSSPLLTSFEEFTSDVSRIISFSSSTNRGMTETEARSTSEVVLGREIKVSRLTFVALLSFYICLTLTVSRSRGTPRLVVPRSSYFTTAILTATGGKTVESSFTLVTSKTGYSRPTITLTFVVALLRI